MRLIVRAGIMFEFTLVEWGLLGFAGLMIVLGIYYEIKGRRGKSGTKN